jgi:oligoribonuclease
MSKDENQNQTTHWVWMDLEMTGLDDQSCQILQAAMIITDPALRELASMELTIWQPESVLSTMIPYVKEMHTKNGLISRVRQASISLDEAEAKLFQMLSQHVPFKKGSLAGNSVYMDRRFLTRYMPSIEHYLHYRQIDVSSFKVVCQQWYGNEARINKKPSKHTALEDVRESIEELKFYKERCFK